MKKKKFEKLLKLNIEGTKFYMQIKGYRDNGWCNCTFRVHSEFISYDLVDDETLEACEVDEIVTNFRTFLDGELKQKTEIHFTEMYIEMILHPATDDNDAYMELKFNLWHDEKIRKCVFTGNYFSLCFDIEHIKELLKYLEDEVCNC